MKLETIGDIDPYPRYDPNLAERLNKLAESTARDQKPGTEPPFLLLKHKIQYI